MKIINILISFSFLSFLNGSEEISSFQIINNFSYNLVLEYDDGGLGSFMVRTKIRSDP